MFNFVLGHLVSWYQEGFAGITLLQGKPGSSRQCREEVKTPQFISVQAAFIGDPVSWERTGLAKVGAERQRSG